MPKARVNGIEMFYQEAGAGEPLVLVMGLAGDHLAWAFQVPVFAERYRVVSFDNRGAGQTDQPDHPYTTRLLAEDTVGLMDALGIERAHVLGVSLGGMIAQELALHHPDRVRSLQLHCTFARPDRYTLTKLAVWRTVRTTLSREDSLRAIYLWIFSPRTWNERPEFIELLYENALVNPYAQSVTGFLRQADAVEGHDTVARLPALRCSTLVSAADDDILVLPRDSRALAALIPGAEFRAIPEAGHVYFLERPEAFNAMCLDFLARQA